SCSSLWPSISCTGRGERPGRSSATQQTRARPSTASPGTRRRCPLSTPRSRWPRRWLGSPARRSGSWARSRRSWPNGRGKEGTMLLTLTRVTVALVVLALAGYLIAIALALVSACRSVAAIADGLETVRAHTGPLPDKLGAINGGLAALLQHLQAADRHLGRAA